MYKWGCSTALVLIGFVLSAGSASAQIYACEAGNKIGIGDVKGIGLKPLVDGMDPCISPNGKEIAYTQMTKNGRSIAILDVATGKSTVVAGIPGKENYGPVWSADGQSLYFNHFKDNDWTLAVVNATGGGFGVIYGKSVAFAVLPDGKGLLCNDMSKFFILSVEDGLATIDKTFPADKKFEGIAIPCRIDVSPYGSAALFEMSVGADAGKDGMPLSSIWSINLENGSIHRVTPKGYNAGSPSWLPEGGDFLFSTIDNNGKSAIYSLSTGDGAKPKQVAQNAGRPTAARQSVSGAGIFNSAAPAPAPSASTEEKITINGQNPAVKWDVTLAGGKSKTYLLNLPKGKTVSVSFIQDAKKGNVDLDKFSIKEGLANDGGGLRMKISESKEYRLVVENTESKPLLFTVFVSAE